MHNVRAWGSRPDLRGDIVEPADRSKGEPRHAAQPQGGKEAEVVQNCSLEEKIREGGVVAKAVLYVGRLQKPVTICGVHVVDGR